MTKALFRKQFLELFQGILLDRKTGKARSRGKLILYLLLFVVIFGYLGFCFFMIAGGLASSLIPLGMEWFFFTLMGLLSIVLGVFGSAFSTYSCLYLAKDNEMMFSLPIPPAKLMLSRLLVVLVTSLMYSALIWIPSVIAYWGCEGGTSVSILLPVLILPVIGIFVTVLSCILGWIVALVASKARNKNFLKLAVSLLIFTAYYVIYFKLMSSVNELLEKVGMLGEIFSSSFHYLTWLGEAACGSWNAFGLVVLITGAMAVLCFCILARSFTKLALSNGKTEKRERRTIVYHSRRHDRALLFREFSLFGSSSTWMLNGGFGLLLMLGAGVYVLVMREMFTELLMQIESIAPFVLKAIPLIIVSFAGLLIASDSVLPVSVSMEGKSLWILQSLPVDPWDLLLAKEKMFILLNLVPAGFLLIALEIVLKMDVIVFILMLIAVELSVYLTADFGLFLNLKHPELSWTNAAVLVKQSAPVMFNLFGGWGFCVALGAGGFGLCLVTNEIVALSAIILVLAVLRFILHHWLKTKGVDILRHLS